MRHILLLSFVVLLQGCIFTYDPAPGSIEIHNYSDSVIYVYDSYSDSLELDQELELFNIFIRTGLVTDASGKIRQDTDSIHSPSYRIGAYDYGEIVACGTCNNPSLCCNNDSIYLFFIKESVMRTMSWEEICEKQQYEQRVVLTEEQLDNSGWSYVYYPKGVKK
jgi:hypothetical protein